MLAKVPLAWPLEEATELTYVKAFRNIALDLMGFVLPWINHLHKGGNFQEKCPEGTPISAGALYLDTDSESVDNAWISPLPIWLSNRSRITESISHRHSLLARTLHALYHYWILNRR
jgi:hypothetical protein